MIPEFRTKGTARGALFTHLLLAWGFIIMLACNGGFRLILGPSPWAIRGVAGLVVITIVCLRRRKFLSEGFQAVGWLIATLLCLLGIIFGLSLNSKAMPSANRWEFSGYINQLPLPISGR